MSLSKYYGVITNIKKVSSANKNDIYMTLKHLLIWIIWDFTCLRYFWEKARPPKKSIVDNPDYRKPSTVLIIFSLCYFLVYFSASLRYENKVNIIENRADVITLQLGTDNFKDAFSRICSVQDMNCPVKPYLLDPNSVFLSLVHEHKHEKTMLYLKEIVELWKYKLNGVRLAKTNLNNIDLSKANMIMADFTGASLKNVDFSYASLIQANLNSAILHKSNFYKANLQGADLYNADFRGAEFNQTNFQKADLREADFLNAVIKDSNFLGAENLTHTQLCKAQLITKTEMDEELNLKIKRECPEILPKSLVETY